MSSDDLILKVKRLGFAWETDDPFLFCVHHDDRYPAGNEKMGPPAASLAGRELGNDFELRDGFRMYHGETVPGFPQHPHRGFETVTLVRRGRIDHSDSLGAAARFGGGDVQWLTAGRGIVHSEMFPLLAKDAPNPLELFQIWLNLPRADKLVEPHFAMLWGRDIPTVTDGGATITIIAGALGDARTPSPPPHSWAARPENDVAIWTIKLAPHARWTLPPAQATSRRTLFFFSGNDLRVASRSIERGHGVEVRADRAVTIENGEGESELLLLQGKPIGEPVSHYGPFVMNTPQEIQQAMNDYRRTLFGGWPWPSDDPVHPRQEGRFARHADGKIERVD